MTGESASFWQPDLKRLEQLQTTGEMTQDEYAQSWAWAHFLLESSPQRLQLLQSYLQSLAKSPHRAGLSESLGRVDPQCDQNLVDHLAVLRQSLQ